MMSKELNAMFQYGTSNEIFMDTDLITIEEATRLFTDNMQDYAERIEEGEDPQMVVWINCGHSGEYKETLYNWYAEDMEIIDGVLYENTGITV